jgi:solute:Na+ symporter, SSS family
LVSDAAAYAVIALTLLVLLAVGLRTRGGAGVDDYVTARGTQRAASLGLSFFASGLGAWILFAPPEVAALAGGIGLAGYALAAACPYAVFALIGPAVRRRLPHGHGLNEFVRARFGRAVHLYVVILSVLYMVVFVIAELTAVGAVATIVGGIDGRAAIAATAVVTLAYTTARGLPASLRTDGWQAWMIVVLVALALAAVVAGTGPGNSPAGGLWGGGAASFQVALTLIVAVVAANLFHQGYWQRMWAATDEAALVRGAWIGMFSAFAVVAVVGAFGLVAMTRGVEMGSPPAPFFALVATLPGWVGAAVLALGVALVASSVDTLENALASLVATERRSLSLAGVRVASILIMVPAVLVAFQGHSVLRLFLVADLLCATAAGPVLLGFWRRTGGAAALAGCAAGVGGALVAGGPAAATFPEAIPALGPFLGAVVASTTVTAVVAARRPSREGGGGAR